MSVPHNLAKFEIWVVLILIDFYPHTQLNLNLFVDMAAFKSDPPPTTSAGVDQKYLYFADSQSFKCPHAMRNMFNFLPTIKFKFYALASSCPNNFGTCMLERKQQSVLEKALILSFVCPVINRQETFLHV